jgi:hypothetical protein
MVGMLPAENPEQAASLAKATSTIAPFVFGQIEVS